MGTTHKIDFKCEVDSPDSLVYYEYPDTVYKRKSCEARRSGRKTNKRKRKIMKYLIIIYVPNITKTIETCSFVNSATYPLPLFNRWVCVYN